LETAKEEISYYDIEFGSGKGIHDMEKAEINDLFDTLKE
jgi:hypothetical protein